MLLSTKVLSSKVMWIYAVVNNPSAERVLRQKGPLTSAMMMFLSTLEHAAPSDTKRMFEWS